MRTNCVLIFLLLFAFVGITSAFELTNGGFEDNFTDWRYYAVGGAAANFTIVNDAYSGSNAASFEITSFPGGDTALDRDSRRVSVTQGDAINISFASKKISTGSTRLMVSVAEFNDSGAFLGLQENYFFAPVNDVYNVYSVVKFISNPTTAYINIGFRIVDDFGLTTVGHYYIDDVTLSESVLVYNGGFEDGTNGWRAYAVGGGTGNFGLSSDAYEGSNAFSFEITTGGGDHGLDRWESRFPAQTGDVFKISAATKKVSTGNTTLKLFVSEWADNTTFLGQSEFSLSSGDGVYGVTELYYSVSNPSTRKMNINFGIYDEFGLKSEGHYLIDDVVLVPSVRIPNGDFENGFTGWRGYAVAGAAGSYTISSDAYEGNSAALMDITVGGGDHALDREFVKIPNDPNEILTFSFAAKRLSAEERTVRFTVSEFDANGTYLGNFNGLFDFVPDTAYNEYEFTYQVANTACAKLNIGFTIFTLDLSAKATGQILIDDVKLVNPQYVTNPGFERNFDYWRYYAVGGSVADYTISNDAYEGSNAALMTVTTAGVDQALDRNDYKISASQGDKMRVSFAAKNATGDDTQILLTVSEFDGAGAYLGLYGTKFFDPDTVYGLFDYYYTVQSPSVAAVNIAFTIFNGDGSAKSTGSYLLDNVEVVKGNGLNAADMNYDLAVNSDDLTQVAGEWLSGNVIAGNTSVVDDFESYADQAALNAKWQEFYWAAFNGSTTSSTFTLLTNPADAYEGSQALRWVYDANDISGNGQDYTDIVMTLDSAIDLRTAQSVKVYLNRHPGNSQENLLYVKFFEGAVDVANLAGQGVWLERAEGSTYSPTGWTEWTANLDELVGADKAGLDQVTAILFGCWSPEADGTSGTGTIDIDSVRVQYEDTCGSFNASDMNGDCVTNMLDMTVLANNWLTESLYY
ncbi:MAG: hypothetical protein ACIAQZ_10830 [Sedimentisphaeraceae bacterium JB056]